MKHVYIVTEGWYSDYHIVAAFSSPEKADEFIEVFPGDGREIERYELDTNVASMARQGAYPWYISMYRDGTIADVRLSEHHDSYAVYHGLSVSYTNGIQDQVRSGRIDSLNGIVYAHSEPHAIKIANDHRAMLIATGQWPQERGKT